MMSVDFNELYQEFIQLTSPPSSTSSVPSPPPLPPELSTPTSGQCHIRFPPTPEKTPRKSVLIRLPNMNNIPDPRTPGTPTTSSEQSISPSGACPVTNSNINSPPGGMMTSHHHYEWSHHHAHQQQQISINQSAEKRKDITGSLPAPPNSPAEPPAKKPALQGVESIESVSDNNNNMNGGGNYHELNSSVLPGMKSLVGPTGPSCIVTNIRSSNSGNVDSVGYMDSHNAGEEDGTDCVIIQKQPPLNELRRLLSAPPVGHSSRSPSQAYPPPPQHGHPCISDYGNPGNDDPGMAGWNIQQMPDHNSHNIHHHQSMNNDMRQHQHQQQQQQHHGPPPLIPYPHPVQPHPPAHEPVEDMVRFQASWTTDTPTYPGGLEVLWREVPEDCKGLITPQDVQETARLRGYFTVCELLALKRTLTSRYTTMKNGQIPYISRPPMTETAAVAAAAAAQAQEIQNAAMGFAGSGSVVKEALAVLHDENSHQQQQQQQCHQQQHQNEQSPQQQPMNPGYNNHSPSHQSSNNNMNGNNNGQDSGGECGGQNNHSLATPIIKPNSTPPPPYRTTTLVFKLLVIGNYRFRSFSESNPNRLRVLFNTNRLSYECHLPMVPSNRDSSQMLRKVLTIDVGFDQICQLRFGYEELHLTVEGRPVLNVAYTPAGPNELPNTPQLDKQDEELLDQIEKGQLKLTSKHSLYFINQRLVHQLENQFKDHPRLKQLFSNCGQGIYSSTGR